MHVVHGSTFYLVPIRAPKCLAIFFLSNTLLDAGLFVFPLRDAQYIH